MLPAVQSEANAGPDSENALLWMFRKYPEIQSKFMKAPLQYAICAPPFYKTLVSFEESFLALSR